MAVNVSDIAAMGGRATAAVVAVAVPPDAEGVADGLLAGLAEVAETLACPLVGGDTTGGPVVMVSVAVLGRVAPAGPVLRSGARPGDAVFVTGDLGGARHALHRLRSGDEPPADLLVRMHRPVPRCAEGEAVAEAGGTAMIDLSDGLGTDLGHICTESGVGVRIDGARVPVAPGASLAEALAGGDDYELCFTATDVEAVAEAFLRRGLDAPEVIGEIVDGNDRMVTMPGEGERPLPAGWEHDVR